MNRIHNPVLRGFHPDPSIVRVGEDYYIATSTFEWWPGVEIHHSKDLANWQLLTRPLCRLSQLDLRGVGPPQGVWAPCLTHDGERFYLLYTIVTAFYCNMYDTHNYLVTAADIQGPWSEPVALTNFGFDPSLFHDDDGRKYMISMVTDHRVPKKYAGRLILQEYSVAQEALIGPLHEVYAADSIFLEGPHIYMCNGWYYLFCADTGTGEGHGQTVLRAQDVRGPYEMYKPPHAVRTEDGEAWSIMTTRHAPDFPLQKAGHGDLVETPDGQWYMAHLCARPLEKRNPQGAPRFAGCRRYMLGRETAIQRMQWTNDGWPVLYGETVLPSLDVRGPDAPPCFWAKELCRETFDKPALSMKWQTLRLPLGPDALSLSDRPCYLRLYGGNGLGSRFAQSLIAQRLTELSGYVETEVCFSPTLFKQMAGLILFYDCDNYLYLHVTHDEELGRVITLLVAENKRYAYPAGYIALPDEAPIRLSFSMAQGTVRFAYQPLGAPSAIFIGPTLDASFLSDEACAEGWFTGTMVGLCCQDLTGSRRPADFAYFEYDPQ